jgi:hypothetical protein
MLMNLSCARLNLSDTSSMTQNTLGYFSFPLYIFSPAQDKLKKRFDVDVCKKWMQHVEDVKSEVCIIYHDSNCDKTHH